MTGCYPNKACHFRTALMLLVLVALGAVVFPARGICETLGIKDERGNFVPKVTVTVGSKDVTIRKINSEEKFRSISVALVPRNASLNHNVGLLKIIWIGANGKAGRPMPFAGPRYDRHTKRFQDSMLKSSVLKIVDGSNQNLFAGKTLADLFQIQIEDQTLVTPESVTEGEQTYQLGAGRDLSIDVSKSSVTFNEDNLKQGETIDVQNRLGVDQVIGVELPERGLIFTSIIRGPGSEKVPKEDWDHFNIAADSTVNIVLIPERDPSALLPLDGKDIVIKVYQGSSVRGTRRIPIRISSDLKQAARESPAATEEVQGPGPGGGGAHREGESYSEDETAQPPAHTARQGGASASSSAESSGSLWLWLLLILNTALLGGLAAYAILFMLPRIQVLEDRLAKSEMFIHASREAIREELEELKEEILGECRRDYESE